MLKRLISAAIGLALFFIIMFSDKVVLMVSVAIITGIALFEAYSAYGYQKNKILMAVGLFSSIIFAFGDRLHGNISIFLMFLLLVICVAILLSNHEQMSTKDFATIIFLTLLIPFVFSIIGYLRRLPNGVYYVWLPFITAWCTDSAAYFAGRFFGKRKLAEKISPKKTVEGSIGGVIGSIVGCLIFGGIALLLKEQVNFLNLMILSVPASVLSQMGDLFASCLKRENQIKDFGNIMPGHGGVLDRFDSLLLTLPFVYVFVGLLPIF